MSNELGLLASGVGDQMEYGTETIFFIPQHQVHTGRKATYKNEVCNYRPLKDDPNCVRLAVGGDRLIYTGDSRSPDASLHQIKLIFNGTISTPGA